MIVPVKFPDTLGGFQESHGMVTIENNDLIFEFSSQDAVLVMFKSGSKRLVIPVDAVASAFYKEGWFSSRFEFKFQTMTIASKLPGHKGPELVLKVRRKDRPAARAFFSRLESAQASVRLERLEQEIKRNEITEDMP